MSLNFSGWSKYVCRFRILLLLMICSASDVLYAQTGSITGRIVDSVNGETLPGANVVIIGTNYGAATDLEGIYRINRIPFGEYEAEVRYLGYRTLNATIVVNSTTIVQDFELLYDVVEGREVLILGQAAGQAAALNQQRASNTIVNVVSSDRIREFPDQNAAESIGRLPGISVQRDAGEGQKVVVRGLSPRFNSITVNGERIPSTEGADRSVDLSMISPDILAGIEVFKAITPDMDADAIGGSINLVTQKAPRDFRASLRAQMGYNDHAGEYGLPRGSINLSNRFFENRLGIMVTANAQRANRSSDLLLAEYDPAGTEVNIEDVNLAHRSEHRDRYGFSLSMDYDFNVNHSVFFSSFLTFAEREELRLRKRYRVDASRVEYDLRDRTSSSRLLSNALSGNHNFSGVLIADWQVSVSSTNTDEPNTHYSRFQELNAFEGTVNDTEGPTVVPAYAKNLLDQTWFQYSTITSAEGSERDNSYQANLTVPYGVGDFVNGSLKFGGKLRLKKRTRDNSELQTPFGATNLIGQQNPGMFTMRNNQNILMENFIDPGFSANGFMNNNYEFPVGLDRNSLRDFQSTFLDWYQPNRYVLLSNYTAKEDIYAAYIMTELNLGSKIMILPGARYENTRNDYTAAVGRLTGNLGSDGVIRDSTGIRSYGELLPMFHVKYQITDNFDIRAAYTKSISRPNYENLAPFQNINEPERIAVLGNPETKHTRATNYDVFFSYYSNKLGFFSAGIYYKDIKDVDYLKVLFRETTGDFQNFRVTRPTNADQTYVRGFEVEWQSNFYYLPRPFNGLLFSVNYSRIWSETNFPFFDTARNPDPPFNVIVIDTFRTGTMPGQANHILNMSLGYEIKGFAARVSMIYYGESLELVGTRRESDAYTDDYFSWDISVNQSLPFLNGLGLFANLNNLSNRPEGAYLGSRVFVRKEEFFGWTGDLGVRMRF